MSANTVLHEASAKDGVAAIIDVAQRATSPTSIDPAAPVVHAFVVPTGARVETIQPNERYLPHPRRLTGHVTVGDVASFAAYVAAFYNPARTTAWIDPVAFRAIAILDDADAEATSWRDHRATLQLVKTAEWERWRRLDGKLMTQEDFARHVEVSEVDIVVPDAAELLEIAQHFYAATTAEFRSGTRLSSGEVQFTWVEEVKATAGRHGDLTIPTKFELLLAPFHGEEPCAVTALLRYRVREGKLAIGYELVRPDAVERDAMLLIAESIRSTVARVYIGSPAS